MKSRKYIWLLFLILLFLSSYIREVLFMSINAHINGEKEFYAKTTELTFLKDWSVLDLNRLKYFFTIVFSMLFISLTIAGLKFTFKQQLPFQITMGIYGLAILLASLLIMFSVTFSSFTSMYPYLRDIVGFIHNPLLFLLISITTISIKVIENK